MRRVGNGVLRPLGGDDAVAAPPEEGALAADSSRSPAGLSLACGASYRRPVLGDVSPLLGMQSPTSRGYIRHPRGEGVLPESLEESEMKLML